MSAPAPGEGIRGPEPAWRRRSLSNGVCAFTLRAWRSRQRLLSVVRRARMAFVLRDRAVDLRAIRPRSPQPASPSHRPSSRHVLRACRARAMFAIPIEPKATDRRRREPGNRRAVVAGAARHDVACVRAGHARRGTVRGHTVGRAPRLDHAFFCAMMVTAAECPDSLRTRCRSPDGFPRTGDGCEPCGRSLGGFTTYTYRGRLEADVLLRTTDITNFS